MEYSEDRFSALCLALKAAANARSDHRVLVNIYEALYVLGDTSALLNLFALTQSQDPQTQAAALRALVEIVDTDNIGDISDFTALLGETELTPPVSEALQELKRAVEHF